MWKEFDKKDLTLLTGNYACLLRGKTDISLMKYDSKKNLWTAKYGQTSQNITHIFLIPVLPDVIQENILLRKSLESGLTEEERNELSSILIRKK